MDKIRRTFFLLVKFMMEKQGLTIGALEDYSQQLKDIELNDNKNSIALFLGIPIEEEIVETVEDMPGAYPPGALFFGGET